MRIVLILILTLFTGSLYIHAQDGDQKEGATNSGPTATISLLKISEQMYVFKGKGGNIGVHFGDDGVLMIDNQFANVTPEIVNLVASFSDKPIQFLVNTHHHGDHTGGNKNMIANGTTVLSHEKARERMVSKERKVYDEEFKKEYDRALEKFGGTEDPSAQRNARESMKSYKPFQETPNTYPMITFSENMNFHYNGEEIMVFHLHDAHTDGDALVYFTESNVLHTGDVFFNGRYPYIDIKNGGNYDGYIAALAKILILVDGETKIIPGHGDIGNKGDVKALHDMMIAVKNSVAFHYLSGKSKEEIFAMKEITKPYDDMGYGDAYISTEKWLTLIYDITKAKYGDRTEEKKKG
ncbi:MAG: MBL fold metallo-hydrolase [Bacteroidota bacterium]